MPFLGRVGLKFAYLIFHFTGYLPTEVSQEETIVRAILSPFHIDKKRQLKVEAFDPTPGTDEISVMRVCFMGSHRCKKKARKVEDPSQKKEFRGFAVLTVRKVAKVSLGVFDSRKNNFRGHADIKTGAPMPPKGQPRTPEELARYRAISKALKSQARYCEDPLPSKRRWVGDSLIADEA
ncbi:MAG: hypothetical protein ACYDC6_14905 [Acidobacteriaceae bacterium]